MQGTKTGADATTRHKEYSLYIMHCKGLKPAAQHSTKRFNSRKSDCFELTSFSLFYCSFHFIISIGSFRYPSIGKRKSLQYKARCLHPNIPGINFYIKRSCRRK